MSVLGSIVEILQGRDYSDREHIEDLGDWERWDEPEQAGYASADLAAVSDTLDEMPTTSMMVVADGRVAYSYGDVSHVSYIASVRKSVLSMLYGPHVDDGTIDLDQTLADCGIDDHRGLTDQEQGATIRDLLEARSGVYHPASNGGDDLGYAPDPGSQEPGEYFLYSNWDFNAAGTVFEQETGQNIYDALRDDLARPLNFHDFDRDDHAKGGDPDKSQHPCYHMHLSTRDKAKIGQLMLQDGQWDGDQLIPADWTDTITDLVTPVDDLNPTYRRSGPLGFGRMWWVWDDQYADDPYDGAYTGIGAYGQYITVLPELDTVVTHKTDPDHGSVGRKEYLDVLDDVVGAYEG